MRTKRPILATWLLLPIALGLAWWIYLPGLHGEFLFDDFANLPALGATGPVTHWSTFFRYITSGTADPTGRPFTLLTFLLDGHDWPTSPYPFKRTNVLLHLLNAALLALLLEQLTRRLFAAQPRCNRARMVLASVLAATLWLIHPLFVSTVLYVVQREAMLPLTFVLIGLMLWLRGRDALLQGRTRAGLVWMVAGLAGCTFLGVLSKANGALLPMYALLIEYVLLARPRRALDDRTATAAPHDAHGLRTYRRTFVLLAWLPALAVISYLVYIGVVGSLYGIGRPWTIGQRLLTEPRILFSYLDLLWLPRPFTPGLFNDQIIPSTSLWHPWTTLPSLLGVAGLLVLAWRLRQRHPAMAFAILFFFAGQLLESTTVALELYYEHRNYVPAMVMFWPVSLWLCSVNSAKQYTYLKSALVLALVAGLAAMCHARADLWGNSQQQALLWAKLNPASPRAQANAANHELAMGEPLAAALRLESILKDHPGDPQIALNVLSAHCQLGGMTPTDMGLAQYTFSHLSTGDSMIFHWLGNAVHLADTGGCPGLTNGAVSIMLDAAERNPRLMHVTGRIQDIDHLRGQLALSRHQPAAALAWFDKGLALRPGPQMAFEQAALLGNEGYAEEGLKHLDVFEGYAQTDSPAAFGMPRIHAWVLRRQNYWSNELTHLRATLQSDMAQQRHAQ